MIYVIRILDQPLVKIGVARNPVSRLRDLQVASPFELVLVATADWMDCAEADIHLKLRDYHVRGAWFRLAGKVEELVAMMQTGQPSLEEWLLDFRHGVVPSRLAKVYALATTGK